MYPSVAVGVGDHTFFFSLLMHSSVPRDSEVVEITAASVAVAVFGRAYSHGWPFSILLLIFFLSRPAGNPTRQ